jgi:hypothetical protein
VKEVSIMKTFAIALVALLIVGGAVPVALAQQDRQAPPPAASPAPSDASPSATAPPAPGAPSGSDMKTGDNADTRGGISADRRGNEDAAGAASPRTEATRTGFFGLSPTAAIIVSVAVLLIVILAIVAMTNNRGTTYVERDRGL